MSTLLMTGTAAAQEGIARGVVMEMDAGLPLHTIYTPRERKSTLGIVVFGNGGCFNDGGNYRELLSEVASHGYIVIANGAIEPADLDNNTTAAQLTEALDWAIAENTRPDSKHLGAIDTAQVAVMGHSCGGRQALIVSSDARVKTSVIVSAGGSPDEVLKALHAPMLYFDGGKNDQAQTRVESDYAEITAVPVMRVGLEVGHNGTLFEEAGGAFGRVIVRWLNWRLKGADEAKEWFVGPECTLCKVDAWSVARKGIE